MNIGITIIILSLFFVGCGETKKNENENKVNSETKTVNPDTSVNKNNQTKTVTSDTIANNKTDNNKDNKTETKDGERKLRYLFSSNAGMRGFYSDGTIGLCPKCDFIQSNLDAMKDGGVFSKYTVEKDGSLLINGHEKEIPIFKGTPGADWVMIDYVWKVKPSK